MPDDIVAYGHIFNEGGQFDAMYSTPINQTVGEKAISISALYLEPDFC